MHCATVDSRLICRGLSCGAAVQSCKSRISCLARQAAGFWLAWKSPSWKTKVRVLGTWSSGSYRDRAHILHVIISDPEIRRQSTMLQEHSTMLEELEVSTSAFRNSINYILKNLHKLLPLESRIKGRNLTTNKPHIPSI